MTTVTIMGIEDKRMTLTSTGTLPRKAASCVPQRSSTPSRRGAKQPRGCGRTLLMLMTTHKHSGWRNVCKYDTKIEN